MPALNFHKQFAPAVEDGSKRQTIRALRKHPIRSGDHLYHYTGMVTKACRKLREDIATEAVHIEIDEDAIVVGANPLTQHEKIELAHADGFNNLDEFMLFFRKNHGLPFAGQLIKW